jgi:hypothetical protein
MGMASLPDDRRATSVSHPCLTIVHKPIVDRMLAERSILGNARNTREQRIIEEIECDFECAANVYGVPVTEGLVTRL